MIKHKNHSTEGIKNEIKSTQSHNKSSWFTCINERKWRKQDLGDYLVRWKENSEEIEEDARLLDAVWQGTLWEETDKMLNTHTHTYQFIYIYMAALREPGEGRRALLGFRANSASEILNKLFFCFH